MWEWRLLWINIQPASFKFSLFILLLPDPVCHFSLSNRYCWATHLEENAFARLKYLNKHWTHGLSPGQVAAHCNVQIWRFIWSHMLFGIDVHFSLQMSQPPAHTAAIVNTQMAAPQFSLWSLWVQVISFSCFNSSRCWIVSVTFLVLFLSITNPNALLVHWGELELVKIT